MDALTDDPLALPDQDVLIEGVPDHLVEPLRAWLRSQLRSKSEWNEVLARAILLRIRRSKAPQVNYYGTALVNCPQGDLLRAINALLQLVDKKHLKIDTFELDHLLSFGGSAYRVSSDLDRLVHRVPEQAQAAFDTAAKTAPEAAARHLQDAWVATYGLDPDYDKAVSSSIKAVEEILLPLVSPTNDGHRTLTKSLATLKREASDWEVALPNLPSGSSAISILSDLMHAMMKAHSSRHGGSSTSRIPFAVEAETVLHLAIALVQVLSIGGLKKA
ncbi:hypothetical protein [Catellatospora paridis]|uniref:hypothetical protein n=1 Tax=Catellatospora paridis TaxID=1617086 RepID=UPI0012D38565|nr:hypothetical protein [Catellatospora paridis]